MTSNENLIIYQGLCLYRDKLISMARDGNEALEYTEILDLLKTTLNLIDQFKQR